MYRSIMVNLYIYIYILRHEKLSNLQHKHLVKNVNSHLYDIDNFIHDLVLFMLLCHLIYGKEWDLSLGQCAMSKFQDSQQVEIRHWTIWFWRTFINRLLFNWTKSTSMNFDCEALKPPFSISNLSSVTLSIWIISCWWSSLKMNLFIFLWQIVNIPIVIISYKDCGILISINVFKCSW
jgi:hypothetical protein